MENDVYEELADWLVTTFRALPGIKKPEFMDLIHFLYTPEQARLVLQIGPEGGKLDALAAKTGMTREALKPLIASRMVRRSEEEIARLDGEFMEIFGVDAPLLDMRLEVIG